MACLCPLDAFTKMMYLGYAKHAGHAVVILIILTTIMTLIYNKLRTPLICTQPLSDSLIISVSSSRSCRQICWRSQLLSCWWLSPAVWLLQPLPAPSLTCQDAAGTVLLPSHTGVSLPHPFRHHITRSEQISLPKGHKTCPGRAGQGNDNG